MPKERATYPDGTPFPDQYCMMPDHRIDTFTVSVRSLGGISPERLRTILQTQLEVTEIEWVERNTVVRNSKH